MPTYPSVDELSRLSPPLAVYSLPADYSPSLSRNLTEPRPACRGGVLSADDSSESSVKDIWNVVNSTNTHNSQYTD